MALDTFAGLKTTIADYLNRDDLTSIIPTFITIAEAKFNRKLRVRQMIKRANGQIETSFFAYPSDWLEAKEFQLNTNPIVRLGFITEAQGDQLKATRFQTVGRPLYYTITGSQLEFIPSPDTTYSAELTYYAKIPALSDSNTSNWLLAYAPDLYLYGALIEASPYLKDDERVATWGQLYTNSLGDIEVADERASVSSTPLVRARSLG
jgi:hypothetical protein